MPRYPVLVVAVIATAFALNAPAAIAAPTTTTLNDWACRPTTDHPHPVVLLHGTMNGAAEWNQLTPDLTAAGYCVFALDYGYSARPILQSSGLGPLAESADQVEAFVDRVLAATGAAKVDIVGQSQGGALAEYYAKNMGHADRVGAEVLLAPPTHGTTLSGVVDILPPGSPQRTAADPALRALACPACADMETDSAFVSALNEGPITQRGVRYAVIATRDDTTVTPPGTASFINEPDVTNLFVQDLDPGIRVEHAGLPSNPAVRRWILQQLDPATAGSAAR
ncbi:alpha/beta fold hydrolase [Nocardia sp. SYP-A9097]|uniref:esterase/lipase family protein n=1 Tax=Nocardia sp. SYP-A9097 TaxID=2663237 RepID=UPI00129BD3B1|nr:alpha/beta fold hydrolase [Nocardia sp. SYP-A9097]MRH91321.1 alpha/beta fold hydrolase [Nocardia sp. SYP-A9097]